MTTTPIPSPLLQLRDVTKRFGGVLALDHVTFEVGAGEIHGLVGENGAGKSTMMKLLAGVFGGDSGEMRVSDQTVPFFSSPAEAQARGIAMVYQELSAFSHLTVAENLFGRHPPARWGFIDWRRMTAAARVHLEDLGVNVDVTQVMGRLSVGQQQLVEIARVILSGARVIILDEPTSALSAPEIARLFAFMAKLRAQGKTMIFISHFLEDVLRVTDRVTVLRNGRRVAVLRAADTNKQEMIASMLGPRAAASNGNDTAAAAAAAAKAKANPREVALSTKGLTKAGAFSDISFQLRHGEIMGVFAFMGAGQLQLGRCLFGAERWDSGTVAIEGKPASIKNTTRAKAAGIAFVPESRHDGLMQAQPVFKNITIAHLARLVGRWVREHAEIEIARAQSDRLGVRPADPLLAAGALSGGNQQKVVLAKWLVQRPKILILNEPTRGMDVGAKAEVLAIVKQLRDEGVAILLVTSEPETIVDLADRAVVMSKGRLTANLEGIALTKENLMSHA